MTTLLWLMGLGALGLAAIVVPPAAWLAQMRLAVDSALPDATAAAKRLVLAHAAYESGFGTGKAARLGNNPFNITAGSVWKGPVILGPDTDGNGAPITQRFRSYPSLADAVRDYWSFLGGPRYSNARAALALGDSVAFVNRLAAAGYFELDVEKYQAGFAAALRKV